MKQIIIIGRKQTRTIKMIVFPHTCGLWKCVPLHWWSLMSPYTLAVSVVLLTLVVSELLYYIVGQWRRAPLIGEEGLHYTASHWEQCCFC